VRSPRSPKQHDYTSPKSNSRPAEDADARAARKDKSGKKAKKSEKVLHAQVKTSAKNISANLQSIEKDLESLGRVRAEADLRLSTAAGQAAHEVEAIRQAAQRLAHDAMQRANEDAQVAWEREEQLRRLQAMESQQAKLTQREVELLHIEKQLAHKAEEQEWARRVHNNRKAAQQAAHPGVGAGGRQVASPKDTAARSPQGDSWERAVRSKGNFPI
jgi:hypothetical protein